MQKWLDQEQLADRWDISPRTLERWRWLNEGPRYTKIGHRVRYSVKDIEQFERDRFRSPGDDPSGFAGIEPAIQAYADGEISIGRLRECFSLWRGGKAYKLPGQLPMLANSTPREK